MNIFTLTGLLASLAGSTCLYLASPNQRWRSLPLPALPARSLALALIVLAWLSLARSMQAVTATFVLVTVLMLALSVLPYVGALRGVGRGR